jgi:hypothetical protein
MRQMEFFLRSQVAPPTEYACHAQHLEHHPRAAGFHPALSSSIRPASGSRGSRGFTRRYDCKSWSGSRDGRDAEAPHVQFDPADLSAGQIAHLLVRQVEEEEVWLWNGSQLEITSERNRETSIWQKHKMPSVSCASPPCEYPLQPETSVLHLRSHQHPLLQ